MTDAAPQAGTDNHADDDRTLRMSRVFAAPREKVFRAWTDPVDFAKWWGPEECTATVSAWDLHPGGTWRSTIHHPSGNEHIVGGTYIEIDAPNKLVFTWAWEQDQVPGHLTTVTLEFFDRDGSTEVTLTQTRFESAEARIEHGKGWASCLKSLETLCTE